jgi:hypothetical protein
MDANDQGITKNYLHTVSWGKAVLSAVLGRAPKARCGEILTDEVAPDQHFCAECDPSFANVQRDRRQR